MGLGPEAVVVIHVGGVYGEVEVPALPLWTQPGDYVNSFEFIDLARRLRGREVDIMFEAKSKDLARARL